MQVNPYLMFNGNCESAFKFYQQCFGGELSLSTHREAPSPEQVAADWRDKILHARLDWGDHVLMGSDCPPEYFEESKGFHVNVSVDDPAEAERVFHTLAQQGTVKMPFGPTFWAFRFGMLVDQFGVPWMVNCAHAA